MSDHDIARFRSKAPSNRLKVLAPVVLVTLAFCALCSHVLIEARRSALERAGDAAANMAVAIEADIVRNVEALNLSLQGVIAGLGQRELASLSPELRQRMLFDHSTAARSFGAILVIDENGRLRYDSRNPSPRPLDLSGRDYFRLQRDQAAPVLSVGQPEAARSSGAFIIGVSKRLTHPDGSFAGVVAGTVQLSHFKKLFNDMSLGPNSTIMLGRADGTMLMRWPFDEALIGRNIGHAEIFKRLKSARSGRFETTAVTDGVHRLFVYSQISDLPIFVSVGQSTGAIYAPWRSYAWTVAMLIVALVAMSGALGWLLLRELNWHSEAEQRLAMLASTDGLTGLSNRWHFDDTIRKEWRRARRDRTPVALLMIDADAFKTYNDTHGHQAGDELLKVIGEAMLANVRRGADLGARYGGDEFAVLLPGASLENAAEVAGKIRAHFNRVCRDKGLAEGARISIGVACLIPERSTGHAALLTAADEALYRAKDGGRNRTELAEAAFKASQEIAKPALVAAA
ncbi:GGDEF domain-containing protein [Rhodoplanes sp. Z2-YC6860]|uniref:GGDEF domain-containing protein n=1 Tax=Rhodoplanes sp. Z2-YC6860 TaxID=674703 RepID=UPI00078E35EC|nr:sensor domain-containing diguanylate cyclase [Rhodoplanes sp. Z2-YC6860]AMN38792.1 diguanylate cyclase [Rhodoplanes sp. Z2-YC6860]